MKVRLAYGKEGLWVELPDDNVTVVEPRFVPGLPDEAEAIRSALREPIGTPLLAGPALLTTSLIMIRQYGNAVTLVAVFLNLAIAGATFYFGDYLMRLLGRAGARALSKVFALFLAAIAVMLVRRGLLDLLHSP